MLRSRRGGQPFRGCFDIVLQNSELSRRDRSACYMPKVLRFVPAFCWKHLSDPEYPRPLYDSVPVPRQERRLSLLLEYLPKLSTLTDEQQSIIYGMIDNMTPPQHNNIDNTLLAAHEDNNASEDDKKADIKLLKDYKSNKKDN